MSKFALISVSDKQGLAPLAKSLFDAGYQLLSTGGTAAIIRNAGIAVSEVSELTGFPEIMGGRVKTLHPIVHGGILGKRNEHQAEAQSNGIHWIDIVVANLYPFAKTVQDSPDISIGAAIEKIDIGGPTMIRAAAKNHAHVTVVSDPSDYEALISQLPDPSIEFRRRMALKAFQHTAVYDGMISQWMQKQFGVDFAPKEMSIPLQHAQDLRYGENPHQKAAFYADPLASGRRFSDLVQHQGKQMSFNNIADLEGALRAVLSFSDNACVIVKHMNPCGAAVHAGRPGEAFTLALTADPVSAFGGIIAFNRPLEAEDIRDIRKSRTFFEVIAAPGLTPEALELISVREKIRVLSFPESWLNDTPDFHDARRVMGGWLFQEWDNGNDKEWRVVTTRQPTEKEWETIRYAWKISQSVKSNAIVLAKHHEQGHVLNGVGAGQMSRVDSVNLAIVKATREIEGSVLASDAFFPKPDGVQAALNHGVDIFVQPGGSIKDDAVIAAVEAKGGVMVLTGSRHFRH